MRLPRRRTAASSRSLALPGEESRGLAKDLLLLPQPRFSRRSRRSSSCSSVVTPGCRPHPPPPDAASCAASARQIPSAPATSFAVRSPRSSSRSASCRNSGGYGGFVSAPCTPLPGHGPKASGCQPNRVNSTPPPTARYCCAAPALARRQQVAPRQRSWAPDRGPRRVAPVDKPSAPSSLRAGLAHIFHNWRRCRRPPTAFMARCRAPRLPDSAIPLVLKHDGAQEAGPPRPTAFMSVGPDIGRRARESAIRQSSMTDGGDRALGVPEARRRQNAKRAGARAPARGRSRGLWGSAADGRGLGRPRRQAGRTRQVRLQPDLEHQHREE